eukprot:CAMPEP_0114236226 /NCGR_PEP_ID=MMETSP0058-20121206/6722_1 /TAXON_ID=36894 /ORGANISM="Pyramimonas parkeae, CCMP726" /LENGTH=84 /DNA_ID=CAMNT_0001348143 /DNA_START=377 /DNA_END=631 /DNA_ORIENTATION=+
MTPATRSPRHSQQSAEWVAQHMLPASSQQSDLRLRDPQWPENCVPRVHATPQKLEPPAGLWDGTPSSPGIAPAAGPVAAPGSSE